jgi:hypothetical protein
LKIPTTDGYPTDDELRFVKNYDLMTSPVSILVNYLEGIWWAPDWGFKLSKHKDEYKSVETIGEKARQRYHYILELHTGGWSGNEDIIRSLEENKWFYNFYWLSSRVGGHYEFRIPLSQWDTTITKKGDENRLRKQKRGSQDLIHKRVQNTTGKTT